MKEYSRLSEIQKDLDGGELQLKDLVSQYLSVIDTKADLNIFREVFRDEALARSEEIQSKIDSGTNGRLTGLVIALKDNIAYKGYKVSASSKILEGFESLYSSTVVENHLEKKNCSPL